MPLPPEIMSLPVDPRILTLKIAGLAIWGTPAGPWGPSQVNLSAFDSPNSVNPPSAAEMTEMAFIILDRRSRRVGQPFHLVVEVESTGSLANNSNAVGTLRAIKRADDVIQKYLELRAGRGAARHERRRPFGRRGFDTMMLTTADSDSGGLQVYSISRSRNETAPVGALLTNRSELPEEEIFLNPLDGLDGPISPPLPAEPDALSANRPLPDGDGSTDDQVSVERLQFGVIWPSGADVAGGIVARAAGPNAWLLQTVFSGRLDNTDVYRVQYATLFGRVLPSAIGDLAPSR